MTIAFDAVEAAVIDRLNALAAVTNIATAIRADWLLWKDRLPCVAVECYDLEPYDDLGGFEGRVRSMVRVRCFADEKAVSRRLEYATRHGRVDNLGASDGLVDWDGVTIDGQAIDKTDWQRTSAFLIEPDDEHAAPIYETTGLYLIEMNEPVAA